MKQKDKIYCGRGRGGTIPAPGKYGWLGNPIALGQCCPVCGEVHRGHGSTLKCYKRYLWDRLCTDPMFKQEFIKLLGHEESLWCFCLDKGRADTCHTTVIRAALQAYAEGKWK